MANLTPAADAPPAASMRHRMPKRFLPILAERTGASQTTIAEVIRKGRTNSRYWPAVVALAEETEAAAAQKGGPADA